MAHNFKGYDSYFLLEEYYAEYMLPKQLVNGCKILIMSVGNIHFKDSLCVLRVGVNTDVRFRSDFFDTEARYRSDFFDTEVRYLSDFFDTKFRSDRIFSTPRFDTDLIFSIPRFDADPIF